MPALTVATQIISDAHSFRALSGEWDRLVSQSAHYSYFLRWHWNWLWWMHLAPATAQLFLVCCRDRSGELVGLAPLYLRARRILSFLKIQELHLLGMGVPLKTSEYVDLLAKPGWEPAVADAIAAALKDQRVWDRLSLAGVPAESPIANRLMEALGLESQSASFDVAPYIDTSCGWDSYKQVLGRSMRRNVEYYRRRLFQQQSCTFERVTNTDRITEAIDDLIRLHQARWQLAGEPGSFAEPKVAAFLHEAVLAAHSACLLRLWVLRINGKTEAALVGFFDNGVMHYFQKGFNPAWAKADLGTVIVSLAVKDCCADPEVRVFDFMSGTGYKTMWAHHSREMLRHEAWRPNTKMLVSKAWDNSRAAAAQIYRAAAPKRLRDARRRWHRERRLQAARALMAAKSSHEA